MTAPACTCPVYKGLACKHCYALYYQRSALLSLAGDYLSLRAEADEALHQHDGATQVSKASEAPSVLVNMRYLGQFRNTDAVVEFIRTEQRDGTI